MAGKGQVYKRNDGKWAFRVKASNGEIVATDGGQGYSAKGDAKATLEKLLRGDYDGPVEESV
ncbi:MAG: YegP family protein [Acidimicrobiales bacterium]